MSNKIRMGMLGLGMLAIGAMATPTQALTIEYDGIVQEYSLPPITLYINGEEVNTSVMPPIQFDDVTLVPIREVFEPLGAMVEWKNTEKRAYIYYEETLITLKYNEEFAWVDGEYHELTVPVKLINDKVMVPVRFISENLGMRVDWNQELRTVNIRTDLMERPETEHPEPERPYPEIEEELEPEIEEVEPEIEEVEPEIEEVEPEVEEEIEPEIEEVEPEVEEEGFSDLGIMEVPRITWQQQVNNALGMLDGVKEVYIGTENYTEVNAPAQSNAKTTVVDAIMRQTTDGATGLIDTRSAISDIDVSMVAGHLVVDIINSENTLPREIIPTDNDFVSLIRTSQLSANTTRVVFDLKSGAKASVELDSNRRQVIINFEEQPVSAIIVGSDDIGDYVFFKDLREAQLDVNADKLRDKVEFTLNNSYFNDEEEWKDLDLNFIEDASLENIRNGSELTLWLSRQAKYDYYFEEVDGNLMFRMVDEGDVPEPEIEEEPEVEEEWFDDGFVPSDRAVFYNYETTNIEITLPEGMVDISQISVTDNYIERQMIVDLGADYSKYLVDEFIDVNDDKVNDISVITDITTKLIIDEARVQAYDISTRGNVIIFDLMDPRERYDKILVIDPGHGGSDPGAVSNGYTEVQIIDFQVAELARLLEQRPDIKIYYTRETDTYITVDFRPTLSNEIGADLFVSVHNNAATSSSANGTEVFYYPTDDGLSKELAEIMINKMISYTGMTNRGAKSNVTYYVLRTSDMPAVLLEGGFLTNWGDIQKLVSDDFNQKYCLAIYESIIHYFDNMYTR
ncbi:MAG: hypothetical protein ATN36_04570 [Epulopiscium sp. Nele67-Bin005]|nr:MAG: hypothetical protein ATN36_04570 [Epulopiscium sp. Nele67-Bin005]